MPKLLLLLTTALLLSLPSTAQTFVNETNRWHNANCCFNFSSGMITCQTKAYKFDGEIEIDGKLYRELLENEITDTTVFTGTGDFYREQDNKVYLRPLNSPDEYLIYDFTLEDGDTILLEYGFSMLELEVLELDSIYLNSGEARKRWTLKRTNNTSGSEATIIEGIGSTYSPLSPINMFSLDCWNEHRCYYVNDILEFYADAGDCTLFTVNTASIQNRNPPTVFPNPVSSSIHIELPDHTTNLQVELRDLQGRIVLQRQRLNQDNTLNLEQLPKGVYFLILFENSKNIDTVKVVKI
ncbi:MAG: T9SS type A sorting domain-containing protein [Bacteroidetes bacterium]|nr:T9SS type A sorting domain-containing protein [Bacteroidota bacterium]